MLADGRLERAGAVSVQDVDSFRALAESRGGRCVRVFPHLGPLLFPFSFREGALHLDGARHFWRSLQFGDESRDVLFALRDVRDQLRASPCANLPLRLRKALAL